MSEDAIQRQIVQYLGIVLPRGAETSARRFLNFVDASGGPDSCWPWTGAKRTAGYGTFGLFGRGSTVSAHRLMCAAVHGLHEDQIVMHSCDNPNCCNPAHLRAGTQKENVDDAIAKGRAKLPPLVNWQKRRKSAPHHWQTFDETAVAEIKRALARGDETQKSIAARYGVTRSAVKEIKAGRTWRHVHV